MSTSKLDVVIAYNIADIEFVEKVAEKLLQANLSVWYVKSSADIQNISENILACKVYLPIMTEQSVVDKNLQEQLSLAYISSSAIYPLSKTRFRFLAPKLNGGAKLMLAKINWCFVFTMEEFDAKLDVLIDCIKKDIQNMSSPRPQDTSEHKFNIDEAFSHGLDLGGDGSGFDGMEVIPLANISSDTTFWDRHFRGKSEVSWTIFKERFLLDYGTKIQEEFPDTGEDKQTYVMHLVHKEVFNSNKIVNIEPYKAFSNSSQPHAFYTQMFDYVAAYLSLREVLSMDSSLRIATIQSLGNFTYPSIISGLSDLLMDDDPNVRAVAAIALAHAGKDRADTVPKLVAILEDEDRLVRESGCLSLGYLRSVDAVPHVVDRWRNDPISTVREAAELALSKMETVDAKRCMKVTQILSSEMKVLKPQET